MKKVFYLSDILDAIMRNNGNANKGIKEIQEEQEDLSEDIKETDESENEELFDPFEKAKELEQIFNNPAKIFTLFTPYGTALLIETKTEKEMAKLKEELTIFTVQKKDSDTLIIDDQPSNIGIIVYSDDSKPDFLPLIIPFLDVEAFKVCEFENVNTEIDILFSDKADDFEEFEFPKLCYTVVPAWKTVVEDKYVRANTLFYVYSNEEICKENFYSKKWLANGGKLYKCQIGKNDIKSVTPELFKVTADVLISA